jgi:hypothetical protein
MVSFLVAAATSFAVMPAQAVPSNVGTFPVGFSVYGAKAFGTDMFVYGEKVATGVDQLVGYFVDFQGNISDPHVFDSWLGGAGTVSQQPFISLKNNSLAFAWTTVNTTTFVSNIKVAYASVTPADDLAWGQAISVAPTYTALASACDYSCGYGQATIAQDPKGRVGISFQLEHSNNASDSRSFGLVTSTNLTKWAKPILKSTNAANGFLGNISLTALASGGFTLEVNQFNYFGGRTDYMKTSLWLPGKKAFSSIKVLSDTAVGAPIGNLVKITPTKYLRLIEDQPDPTNSNTALLCYRILDTKAKTWSAKTCFDQLLDGQVMDHNVVTTDDNAGLISFVFSTAPWDNQGSHYLASTIREFEILNGNVPTSISTIGTSSNPIDSVALYNTPDDNLEYVYFTNNSLDRALVADGQVGRPDVLLTTDPASSEYFQADQTQFQTPAIVEQGSTGLGATVRFILDDSAPVLAKLHAISGRAKVGKTLKTTIPFFNSPNGYSASTFQWYSCGAKMFVHFNDIPTPGVCNPIPGATKLTYKIRKQDKGYYLAVAATNHNSIGSTTVLSNATTKIK